MWFDLGSDASLVVGVVTVRVVTQPVVGSLGLIYPVAASGHNYLALIG
jgi:hypothetical protein